jgi:peptidylprolyl isomerase
MAFCHFTTTKGDITAQLEYEKHPLPLPISLPLQKEEYFVTDDKLKRNLFWWFKISSCDPDFMIQGGDPSGTGSAGTGYVSKMNLLIWNLTKVVF